jgi:hypothetical protein
VLLLPRFVQDGNSNLKSGKVRWGSYIGGVSRKICPFEQIFLDFSNFCVHIWAARIACIIEMPEQTQMDFAFDCGGKDILSAFSGGFC